MSSSHLLPFPAMALFYNIDIINIYSNIFYFDNLIISQLSIRTDLIVKYIDNMVFEDEIYYILKNMKKINKIC